MGKYSTREDIQDELIKNFTKESDHLEAEEYVDKVLSKVGINPKCVSSLTLKSVLKRLAIVYATYKRAFYESKTKGDIFYQKYELHESMLKDLTSELTRPDVYLAEDKVEEWVLENRLDEILCLMTVKYKEEVLHFVHCSLLEKNNVSYLTNEQLTLELECLKEMATEWYRDTLIEEYPDMIRD